MPRLVEMNALRCKNCGDIIVSTYRHEMVTCVCGDISVDGGSAYCKVSVAIGAKGYASGLAMLGKWPPAEPTSMKEIHHRSLEPKRREAADTLRANGVPSKKSASSVSKKGKDARKRKEVKRV